MRRENVAVDQHLAGVVARFASVVREWFGESVIGLEHVLALQPTVFDPETCERWRAEDRALVSDIETERIRV